jgi:3-deoxy-manno-octulosonate cytidylyltransferase (CMP-KDO synthetase)
MKVIAVIPARLESTRLARKVLRPIAGQPMLGRVYQGVGGTKALTEVIVATDSQEILDLCRERGWQARLTSASCRSGTERVHEVSQSISADVYINVQGDEPMARAEHINSLIELMKDPAVQVGTLKTPCATQDVNNPHAVKVVTDSTGRALYFSRAAIPYDRDRAGARYYKHLGFYAYRKAALNRFVALPESPLERSERLEQLRFLENGIAIQVAETPFDTIGVDTEEDLRRAEELLIKDATGR